MASVLRKKPNSVIRTPASKPASPRDWKIYLKPMFVVFGVIFAYIVSQNWSSWLARLDPHPIRAYALTHKTQFTTNSDIREILSKEPMLKGYFEQDIAEVKQKFLTMPWIRDVAVRKIYPDRLSLTLVEYRSAGRWNDRFWVSPEGSVFELPADRFDGTGLPVLYGPDSEGKKVLEAWYKIQKDLESRNLRLKSVSMDIRGSWEIQLDNQIKLVLGRGDWLPKIDRFVTIFPDIQIPAGKRLEYVDLRYEHGAAVGFASQ